MMGTFSSSKAPTRSAPLAKRRAAISYTGVGAEFGGEKKMEKKIISQKKDGDFLHGRVGADFWRPPTKNWEKKNPKRRTAISYTGKLVRSCECKKKWERI
jgi:hypothetical protein